MSQPIRKTKTRRELLRDQLIISTQRKAGSVVVGASHNLKPALLCIANGIHTQKTNNRCEAASIPPSLRPATNVHTPHKKLREAAPHKSTLNAHFRPPAQPFVGYTPPTPAQEQTIAKQIQVQDTTLTTTDAAVRGRR